MAAESSTVSRHRPAFTMIEFVAVLALAAILAASTVLSLGSYRRNIALEDAFRQIELADALVRGGARSAGVAGTMRVDLSGGVISRALGADGDATLLALPAGVKIERLEIAGIGTGYGNASVPFTRNGQSPSYAMLIADAAGRRDWLVVAGLTGQVTHVDEQAIDELLAAAPFHGGGGPDAH